MMDRFCVFVLLLAIAGCAQVQGQFPPPDVAAAPNSCQVRLSDVSASAGFLVPANAGITGMVASVVGKCPAGTSITLTEGNNAVTVVTPAVP